MEIQLTLALPRDELSIPVVRRITASALAVLGSDEEASHDIQVALSEACTNVIDHSGEGDEYEVRTVVDGHRCVIEIVDTGRGYDHAALSRLVADPSAEQGRGLAMISALMDVARFESRPEDGTIVHLEKSLTWAGDSVMARLSDDGPAPVQPAPVQPGLPVTAAG